MLHGAPSIESAVGQLADVGIRRIVHVSLSPYDAESTTGAYRAAMTAAVAGHEGVTVEEAADYRHFDEFLDTVSDSLGNALQAEEITPHRSIIVFSAHSLPVEDMERDPSYVEQIRETASAVADRAGLGPADGFEALSGVDAFGGHSGSRPWLLAFQSKGRRGGDWIGPDLDDVIDAAVAQDYGAVVVSPIGFTVDHMETLYDLDVCAADRALGAGIEFARAKAPNDDSRMIEALAEAVHRVL
jgi:ferrochelatase